MNQVNEVGAVERGYNEADNVDAVDFVDWVLTWRTRYPYYATPRTPYHPVLQSRSPVIPYIEPNANGQKKSQI